MASAQPVARPTDPRSTFALVQVVGGTAVLGSYVWGFLAYPDGVEHLWGDIPDWAIAPYTSVMPFAALGYLAFAWFVWRVLDAEAVVFGVRAVRWFTGWSAVMLVCSAAWMPLCESLMQRGMFRPGVEYLTWADLLVTALASLAMLAGLLRLDGEAIPRWKRVVVGGMLCFCVQTVVLDALVWPWFMPVFDPFPFLSGTSVTY